MKFIDVDERIYKIVENYRNFLIKFSRKIDQSRYKFWR